MPPNDARIDDNEFLNINTSLHKHLSNLISTYQSNNQVLCKITDKTDICRSFMFDRCNDFSIIIPPDTITAPIWQSYHNTPGGIEGSVHCPEN